MKQLFHSETAYEVAQGEVVTLVFTPVGIAPDFIAVASDDLEGPDPGNPNFPTYNITVNEGPGLDHPCEIECSFPGPGDNRQATVKISGSLGGEFDGPTFTPDFPARGLDIRVAAGSSKKAGAKSLSKTMLAPSSKKSSAKKSPAKKSSKKLSSKKSG